MMGSSLTSTRQNAHIPVQARLMTSCRQTVAEWQAAQHDCACNTLEKFKHGKRNDFIDEK
tara:strand:+ start:174114 stop:174293 length:180 start_codon:yes stop_codon:yes gene_type:complete